MQQQLPTDTFYIDNQGRFIVSFDNLRAIYTPTAAQYLHLAKVCNTVAQQMNAGDNSETGERVDTLAFTEVAGNA